jgi:hypothetical protein
MRKEAKKWDTREIGGVKGAVTPLPPPISLV